MKIIAFISLFAVFSAGLEKTSLTDRPTCVSADEKKLYDMILDYRKSRKLGSIPLSAKLCLVAQTHARDLADNYTFDPANSCNPHSWSEKGNWSSCCYTSDHKQAKCMWDKPAEIAGYNSPGYEIAYYSSVGSSPSEALEGWKKSPAHNPLLINQGMWEKVEWRAIGIGLYKEYGVVWFGQMVDPETPEVCK